MWLTVNYHDMSQLRCGRESLRLILEDKMSTDWADNKHFTLKEIHKHIRVTRAQHVTFTLLSHLQSLDLSCLDAEGSWGLNGSSPMLLCLPSNHLSCSKANDFQLKVSSLVVASFLWLKVHYFVCLFVFWVLVKPSEVLMESVSCSLVKMLLGWCCAVKLFPAI